MLSIFIGQGVPLIRIRLEHDFFVLLVKFLLSKVLGAILFKQADKCGIGEFFGFGGLVSLLV